MNKTADIQNLSDTPSGDDTEFFGWVNYFLVKQGHEFFSVIDKSYLNDNFNLKGLLSVFQCYDLALDMIRDVETEEDFSEWQADMIENNAAILYGLIHARWIITAAGMRAMLIKYRHRIFGSCPRVLCDRQSLLPVGLSDKKGAESVKLYCVNCREVYKCMTSNIDGAFFGTTFPHLFFLIFPELRPKKAKQLYKPRIFGFMLHSTSHEQSLEAVRAKKARKQEGKKI